MSAVVLGLALGARTAEAIATGLEAARRLERPARAVFAEPPDAVAACASFTRVRKPARSRASPRSA